ncbi:MAG: hypothetical protein ACK5Q5_02005 [Planctomycetaceae bacterium]
MAIQFQCPNCSATIRVPDEASGKIGQCPKCGARLQVPKIAPPTTPPAALPPAPSVSSPAELPATPLAGGLLGDKSAVFVLPPANRPEAPIGSPPESVPTPPPQHTVPAADPVQAREEYSAGRNCLSKPHVRGAGWPAADRAVRHFQRAAELDPQNGDYATQTGIASQQSIKRFLESWGTGPLTSIAAFHLNANLGQQIDKAESLFRPSGISPENHFLLIERANEGLRWFSRALELDPDDAVARCHRAELLYHIGAFPKALEDAKVVLSSPLVPSQTRDAAQRVADFVLGEDSPLRKYLTRSQAQQLPPPGGVKLPPPSAPKQPVAATSPVLSDGIGPIVINTGNPSPIIAPSGSLDPTQAEIPMFSAPSSPGARSSVAARLRTRRKGNWTAVIIPVVLGLLLLAISLGYMYFNRVTFIGAIAGEDLGNHTLQKTLYRNEFGIPEDRADALVTAFREDPETLRTSLRVLVISGTSAGLSVSLRPGADARLVGANPRADDPHLAEFCRNHAEQLEAPLPALRAEVLKKFATDFETARSSGMRLGNLGDYLDGLGGNLLVQGLGFHVTGIAGNTTLPCVFEDQAGVVYFLVPNDVTQFDIVERKFDDAPSVFKTDMRYQVTIAKTETPVSASPPQVTEPEQTDPTNTPAADQSQDGEAGATTEFGDPEPALPPGFYSEDQ